MSINQIDMDRMNDNGKVDEKITFFASFNISIIFDCLENTEIPMIEIRNKTVAYVTSSSNPFMIIKLLRVAKVTVAIKSYIFSAVKVDRDFAYSNTVFLKNTSPHQISDSHWSCNVHRLTYCYTSN